MPDFKTHTKINNIINAAFLLPGIGFNPTEPGIYCLSFGIALSTFFMSPDVDMDGSMPDQLSGGLFWNLYSKIMHHRGRSHLFIIGTFSRILYVELIPLIIVLIWGDFFTWKAVHQSTFYWWTVAGVLVGDNLHIAADTLSTYNKRGINEARRKVY